MDRELGEIDGRPTFCLVHGRYHGDWCWRAVQEELTNADWRSIAPNLPIEDSDMSLNDHAVFVRQAELMSDAKEIVRVGWSWGANVIPRALGANAVKKLVFVAGSFHPATLRRSVTGESLPKRSISYEVLIRNEEKGFDEIGDYVFYHDLEDEHQKKLAIRKLRPHPRREIEPGLAEFPNVPIEYVLLTNDHALVPEAQADTAEALGVQPVCFKSGHTPMLSKPKELAKLLIELATKE